MYTYTHIYIYVHIHVYAHRHLHIGAHKHLHIGAYNRPIHMCKHACMYGRTDGFLGVCDIQSRKPSGDSGRRYTLGVDYKV